LYCRSTNWELPWTLWFLGPLGSLPFELSRAIWLSLIAISLLSYIWANRNLYPTLDLSRLLICCIAFLPLIVNFRLGQSNFIPCLGLLLFLKKPNTFLAGLGLSLTIVKVHLFLPLYAAVAVSDFTTRSFKPTTGLLTGSCLQLGLSLLFSTEAFFFFPEELTRNVEASSSYAMPSIAAQLEATLPNAGLSMLLLGTLAGGLVGLRGQLHPREILVLLVPLGMTVSPYVWSHSFVCFLPGALMLFERGYKSWGSWCSLAIACTVPLQIDIFQRMLWVPLVMLASYGLKAAQRNSSPN